VSGSSGQKRHLVIGKILAHVCCLEPQRACSRRPPPSHRRLGGVDGARAGFGEFTLAGKDAGPTGEAGRGGCGRLAGASPGCGENKAGVVLCQAVVIDLLVAGSREFRRPGYRRDGQLTGGFFRNTWVMLPDLPRTPVFRVRGAIAAETSYPLKLGTCPSCFLVQIDEYRNAKEIFNEDYACFSSYSKSWLAHSKAYTDMITERFGYNDRNLVVEIASNDG